jgi:DNA-binding IclR family transcriptional regulator
MSDNPAIAPAPTSPLGAGQKTLLVLEAAVQRRRFTDIVATTGLPKSTVHRLLASLVSDGYLAGNAERGFTAGGRLVSLAAQTLSGLDVARLAAPVIDELVERVDCTVHLGQVSGTDMVYLVRRDATKPYRMKSRVGGRIPLHSSGMGKAVMALWDPAEVRELATTTGLPARTQATITDPDALADELQHVRSVGYALDLGENEVGTVCVAAAIADHTGRPVYGLSISSIEVEHPGHSIEALAADVVTAARAITDLVGGRPGA